MKLKICLLGLLVQISIAGLCQHDLKLWYKQPAANWNEALPIGNGTIGGMVYGKVREEIVSMNEATFWSGGPAKTNVNPTAFENLKPLREALFNSDYGKATALARKMQGNFSESYLPLGNLFISQLGTDSNYTHYTRNLDIEDAIATTSYTIGGVQYKREMFVSTPDHVMIIRLSSDKGKQLNIHIAANSLARNRVDFKNDLLIMKGKAPSHTDPTYYKPKNREYVVYDADGCNGMRFEMLVKAVSKDGNISSDTSGLNITNASEIVLYVTAATSFNGYDRCPLSDGKDEVTIANGYLSNAVAKSYSTLLTAHLEAYHKYFNRVSITLNKEESKLDIPTDERLDAYSKGGTDAGLEALYYQYGRYLLISSSQTPNAPANLQGIWNKELRAPWSSNYTTNINVQMNYWPAESTNLSELNQPLFDLIKELHVTGTTTAKEFYHLKGWVVHHNSDIWALSNAVGDKGSGDPKWANWAMGANWLSRHIWEHYLFTGDKKFLQDNYSILKDAAVFSLGWLVPDSSGHLVTAPSTSPENDYLDGTKKLPFL